MLKGSGMLSQSARTIPPTPRFRLPNRKYVLPSFGSLFSVPSCLHAWMHQKGAICIYRPSDLGIICNTHFYNTKSGCVSTLYPVAHIIFAQYLLVSFKFMVGEPSNLYVPQKWWAEIAQGTSHTTPWFLPECHVCASRCRNHSFPSWCFLHWLAQTAHWDTRRHRWRTARFLNIYYSQEFRKI